MLHSWQYLAILGWFAASAGTVQAEVEHFFNSLGFHCMYYQHFTSMQIAKHIQCLIAALLGSHPARNTKAQQYCLVIGS